MFTYFIYEKILNFKGDMTVGQGFSENSGGTWLGTDMTIGLTVYIERSNFLFKNTNILCSKYILNRFSSREMKNFQFNIV